MKKINVALYGVNGHQLTRQIGNYANAKLVAVAAFPEQALADDGSIKRYDALDELLKDKEVDLVSLCSPMRRDQAQDAIKCMKAGKHVYAEKPCAFTEDELNEIIATSEETGLQFHDMAGTAFAQPYLEMRRIVQAGEIGEVVQVFSQKSYPYHDKRPQEEDKDGGLTMQVGVHAMRFIEHITGLRCLTVESQETKLGNPQDGDLKMASSSMIRLENGGLAVSISNYLNPKGIGIWGYNAVRIFGTKGLVECSAPGNVTRLVIGDEDRGELDQSAPSLDYFQLILDSLLGGPPLPLDLKRELHPTRTVIRARESARRNCK
jgi:predicted dehydrogenase